MDPMRPLDTKFEVPTPQQHAKPCKLPAEIVYAYATDGMTALCVMGDPGLVAGDLVSITLGEAAARVAKVERVGLYRAPEDDLGTAVVVHGVSVSEVDGGGTLDRQAAAKKKK